MVSSRKNSRSTLGSEAGLPAIKVVLTNGCGFEGLASEFKEYCAKLNLDVIRLDNTPKPIWDKSVILIKKGDREDLHRLQKMTGISLWTEARNEDFDADFEIILGRDFDTFMK
ncbi:MAG: LytR C-terminal domain-containing protein [Candidatus Cloacimonetes bacterium]|nr:LytR C-terminal domain-containing protein [Candidatus Cloacimonadota bacterium]